MLIVAGARAAMRTPMRAFLLFENGFIYG